MFIELLAHIANAPPLYKYFPTKINRHFVAAVSRIHEHGTLMVICMYTVLYAQMWHIYLYLCMTVLFLYSAVCIGMERLCLSYNDNERVG